LLIVALAAVLDPKKLAPEPVILVIVAWLAVLLVSNSTVELLKVVLPAVPEFWKRTELELKVALPPLSTIPEPVKVISWPLVSKV
jgi:hypothetical protein